MKYQKVHLKQCQPTTKQRSNLMKQEIPSLIMSTLGKREWYGVNGHAIGRFWEIGPQQTLYMPGCWLKKGRNEIIVLDLKGPQKAIISGLSNLY